MFIVIILYYERNNKLIFLNDKFLIVVVLLWDCDWPPLLLFRQAVDRSDDLIMQSK